MRICVSSYIFPVISLWVTSCNLMDPMPSQRSPNSALHRAVLAGDTQRVKSLSSRNPAKLDQLSRGRTALAYAVSEENHELAEILLKAGAHPDISSTVTGLAPIHTAANDGDLPMVKTLIRYGSNPLLQGRTPNDSWTPIGAARRNGHREVVDYLMSKSEQKND